MAVTKVSFRDDEAVHLTLSRVEEGTGDALMPDDRSGCIVMPPQLLRGVGLNGLVESGGFAIAFKFGGPGRLSDVEVM